jgi:hypothetical protein
MKSRLDYKKILRTVPSQKALSGEESASNEMKVRMDVGANIIMKESQNL